MKNILVLLTLALLSILDVNSQTFTVRQTTTGQNNLTDVRGQSLIPSVQGNGSGEVGANDSVSLLKFSMVYSYSATSEADTLYLYSELPTDIASLDDGTGGTLVAKSISKADGTFPYTDYSFENVKLHKDETYYFLFREDINPEASAGSSYSGGSTYRNDAGAFSTNDYLDLRFQATFQRSLSSQANIISVEVPEQIGESTIDTENHSVEVHVPYGYDVSSVSPAIQISEGATIDPASYVYVDFSDGPVSYTITAEDQTTQEWTLELIVALNSENEILSFTLPDQLGYSRISASDSTIEASVLIYANLEALAPAIEVSPGATISPESGEAVNFSAGSVTYTVTAEDNSVKEWTVTVEQITEYLDKLVIKPGSNEGKDAVLSDYSPDNNYGTHESLFSLAWTVGGNPLIIRSLIAFDFNQLPDTIEVVRAHLSLYSYNSASNGSHSTLDGPNTCFLKRVTSSWNEETVTWNTQPSVTETDMAILASSTNDIQHYSAIDITDMFNYQRANPSENFGFMMQLETEEVYRRMLFASSDNPDTNLYPEFVIYYPREAYADAEILSFSLDEQTDEAILSDEDDSIYIMVNSSADLTALAPVFELSERATSVPASGDTVDFSSGPVTYIVTAEDGSTKNWTVAVDQEIPTDPMVVLKPNSAEGKDAVLSSYSPDNNYGEHESFFALAWTAGGSEVVIRSLIEFDLSEIPDTFRISEAYLSLFSYNSVSNGAHAPLSGSNKCFLKRVTSPWEEATVTWNTQPTVTDEDMAVLDSSINEIQDYPEVDLTNMLKYLVRNPDENYGFMMQLETESIYRRMLFASSDYEDAAMHPELIVYHTNEPYSGTDILSFVLDQQTGDAVISKEDHTVSVEVSIGTDLTDLTPTIELSERAHSDPASGETIDFSAGSVSIKVTAEDGETSQEWIVEVTEAQAPLMNDINLADDQINIYPTHCQAVLYVEQDNDKPRKGMIYNSLGQLVESFEIQTKKTAISVSGFSTGMYYIVVDGEYRTRFFKD